MGVEGSFWFIDLDGFVSFRKKEGGRVVACVYYPC